MTSPSAKHRASDDLSQDALNGPWKGGEQMLLGIYRWVQTRYNELQNERGATAVEYGLMVALIAAVIIAVVTLLGGDVSGAFQKVVDAIP
jgi:pilus assembly protein Flp/PilA